MQYLLVKFREDRKVVVDDHLLGATNQVIELEEGVHSISLAEPYDFYPDKCRVLVVDSTVVNPVVVEFT
ncbi:MAG TPA: hypothetical protein PKM20_02395 [Nitrosomonas sp.]|nr:MAG: hypothetical protein NMNS02_06350 [Nitrosomonas sp.]HBV20204.1 hypothetical protein [Nitrosomonas sp.]HNP25567.1 hypothetical protein [Nitrosomonas sp.]